MYHPYKLDFWIEYRISNIQGDKMENMKGVSPYLAILYYRTYNPAISKERTMDHLGPANEAIPSSSKSYP